MALQLDKWLSDSVNVRAKFTFNTIDRYCPECGHSRGDDYETDGCAHCIKQEWKAAEVALEDVQRQRDEARRERDHWQSLAAQYAAEREHNANMALMWQAECESARQALV